jgi:lipoprotein-anchoring transpeptidase ErfK/SrfK
VWAVDVRAEVCAHLLSFLRNSVGVYQWSTALGGGIGLHGTGDAGLAGGGDWSAGCVALSDADIEELFGVLRIGDVVEILP